MDLLRRIEKYLQRTCIKPTRFGRDVLNDPRFVFDLRLGREVGSRVRRRVDAYLAEHAR